MTKKQLCTNCSEIHICYEVEKETDSDDEEWPRHTQKYQDAYSEFMDSIASENWQSGEILMLLWIKENHDKLCCKKRHENQDFS